jgi:hypothetical protein
MSPFTVDLSHVEEFEPVPAGVYSVVVTEMNESEEDGPSGYPYVGVVMTILEGEFENRKLFSNLSMSPKAAFKVKEFLEACGVPEEQLTSEEFEFDPEEYVNAEFDVAASVKNVDGVMRNAVTNFISAGGEVETPKRKPSGGAPKGRKIR